jgi:predicted RND superfamily exporter protein
MQPAAKRDWPGLLAWPAAWPRLSALAALAAAGVAASIGPPAIDGSMIDRMSGDNPQAAIAREIRAATGDRAVVAVVVEPDGETIGEAFARLESLRSRLAGVGAAVTMSSIDAARDQLFLYGLTTRDPVHRLLADLRDTPRSAGIIDSQARRFLIVIGCPRRLERQIVRLLHGQDDANDWRVLAGAELEHDIAHALLRDLRVLIPAIVITMLAALFAAFGSWRALIFPVFASFASVAVTLAAFSVAGVAINLITLLALPIVLIVALANSCHFIAKSRELHHGNPDISAAVRTTLRRVGPAFFFSCLTTAIALASLGLNDIPPISDLGLVSASALSVVFLLLLLGAPWGLRQYLTRSPGPLHGVRLFAAGSRWLAAHRRPIGAFLVAAMVFGLATIPGLPVRSDPRAFLPDGAPFSRALRAFEKDFYVFSPFRVLVSVDAPGRDSLFALRQAGSVRDALAGSDGIRQVDMEPAAGRKDAYLVSALMTDDGRLDATVALMERVRRGLPQGVHVVYSNAGLVYDAIDRQAMRSLLESLASSAALIFGAILALFRSWRAIVSALLANTVPLAVVCGAVWLIGNPLNLVTVFVFLIALGVIVDDAIHILFVGAAGDRLAGSSIEFSVILSTLMLCLGLGLCQFSAFPTTRQFAAYCALALATAVVSNLTVLPLVLRWRARE